MSHLFSRGKLRAPSAGRTTHLLLSLLALAPFSVAAASDHASEQLVIPLPPPLSPEPPEPANHVFTLRHIYHHGAHRYPSLHRRQDYHDREADVFLAKEDGDDNNDDDGDDSIDRLPPLQALSHGAPIQRLVDRRPSVVDPMVALARERGYVTVLSPDAWTIDSVPTPNITDKATVVSLAYMASNAYVATPAEPDWDDVGAPFNRSADFGWEGDGLRGHVFADATNATIVIGLKGTSTAVFDGEGTTTNDKENDNLFFGCCCGQQGQWTYRQVCSCATGTYACNNTCVRQALRDENRYYTAARELYSNVTALYPDATVWLTGHSLGGALASFLGLTYGLPAVTFQAVPEAMAVARLGLPVPPGADPDYPQMRAYTGTHHVGHTADPIYMGICNGASAACTYAGYALESSCHTGYECVYDVVADKGWRVGVGTHRIRAVIRDVLLPYDTVPVCTTTPECRDCARWHMYESNGTEPVSSSTSSSTTATTAPPTSSATTKTRTRTQTCQTPGWWGCLDSSTTTTTTTTSETTTSTTTCHTPGWFGCLDKTTTTTTTTSSESSTTCETPGRFWGCRDEPTHAASSSSSSSSTARTLPALPTNTATATATATATTTTTTSSSSQCLTPGRIWGCWDDEPSTASSTTTVPTITPPPGTAPAPVPTKTDPAMSSPRCRRRGWFGGCKDWGSVDDL